MPGQQHQGGNKKKCVCYKTAHLSAAQRARQREEAEKIQDGKERKKALRIANGIEKPKTKRRH